MTPTLPLANCLKWCPLSQFPLCVSKTSLVADCHSVASLASVAASKHAFGRACLYMQSVVAFGVCESDSALLLLAAAAILLFGTGNIMRPVGVSSGLFASRRVLLISTNGRRYSLFDSCSNVFVLFLLLIVFYCCFGVVLACAAYRSCFVALLRSLHAHGTYVIWLVVLSLHRDQRRSRQPSCGDRL